MAQKAEDQQDPFIPPPTTSPTQGEDDGAVDDGAMPPPPPPEAPTPIFAEGLPEIGFELSGGFLPVLVVTDEMRELLLRAGEDPREYDRMEWPTGISRFARGKFLLHESSMQTLMDEMPETHTEPPNDDPTGVIFRMGTVLFERMYVRNPYPICATEATGTIYSITVVDNRFRFQFRKVDPGAPALTPWPAADVSGFNVTADDKTVFYEETLNEEVPFSVTTASERLISFELSGLTELVDWNMLPASAMGDSIVLRDLVAENLTVARLLDRLASLTGYVWTALREPSRGRGYFYNPVRIVGGANSIRDWMREGQYRSHLIAGGFLAGGDAKPGVEDALNWRGLPEWARVDVPQKVRVCFPTAMQDGRDYVFNTDLPAPDDHRIRWVTDRMISIEVSLASIQEPGSNLEDLVATNTDVIAQVGSSHYAIFDGENPLPGNFDFLEQQANNLAGRYYSRFLSGAGRAVFRGWLEFPGGQWAGASRMIWSIGPEGPMTVVDGELHDPLFGFSSKQALTPEDIYTIGRVRSLIRPEGGVTLDVTAPKAEVGIYPGKITEVFPTVPFTYSCQSCDGTIELEDVTPIDRTFPSPTPYPILAVTGAPPEVDDPCWIAVDCNGDAYMLAYEIVETAVCPEQAAQLEQSGTDVLATTFIQRDQGI